MMFGLILLLSTCSFAASQCLTCTLGSSGCDQFDPYAQCKDCPEVIGDIRSDIKSLVFSSNSVVRRLCRVTVDKAKCLEAATVATTLLEILVDEMLPAEPSESSKLLTCGHLLSICPDIDSKGEAIEDGSWSCSSCGQFLEHIYTILSKPVPKLNAAMTKILCPNKNADCLLAFTDVVQVSGLLGEYLKNKRTGTALCEVMKCVN